MYGSKTLLASGRRQEAAEPKSERELPPPLPSLLTRPVWHKQDGQKETPTRYARRVTPAIRPWRLDYLSASSSVRTEDRLASSPLTSTITGHECSDRSTWSSKTQRQCCWTLLQAASYATTCASIMSGWGSFAEIRTRCHAGRGTMVEMYLDDLLDGRYPQCQELSFFSLHSFLLRLRCVHPLGHSFARFGSLAGLSSGHTLTVPFHRRGIIQASKGHSLFFLFVP